MLLSMNIKFFPIIYLICTCLVTGVLSQRDWRYRDKAWTEFGVLDSQRPFDLKGSINRRFALTLALMSPDINMVCSPTSAAMLLTALAIGAEDPTLRELVAAIGINNIQELKSTYRFYVREFNNLPGSGIVKVASRLYLNIHHRLNGSYCQDSVEIFGTCIETMDFAAVANTYRTINKWIEDNTAKKIHRVISPAGILPFISTIMVTAVYFGGVWKTSFELVEPKPFNTKALGERTVDMMKLTTHFKYTRSDTLGCHIVEIPYDGDAANFILMLPLVKGNLEAVMRKILDDPLLFRNEMLNLTETEVKLSMPKFRMQSRLDLTRVFKEIAEKSQCYKIVSQSEVSAGRQFNIYANFQLYLRSMFSPKDTALNNIVQYDKIYASIATQTVLIEVNEKGKGATDPAGTSRDPNTPSVEVNANHPFLFYVKSRTQQLVVGVFNGPPSKVIEMPET